MSAAGLHRRLWSLWEMLELKAASFYEVTSRLHGLRHQVERRNATTRDEESDNTLTIRYVQDPVVARHLLDDIKELKDNLGVLHLRMVLKSADKLESEISSERGFLWSSVGVLCNEVHNRLLDELSLTKVFVLDSREQEYYEPQQPIFGSDVASKFQTEAAFEIDEAAKCLALGRATASVFHLMRTMEMGIRAVARCFQIPDPIKPTERNWGRILENIMERGIKQKWPTAADRMSHDARFFEELHGSLDAVRNAWRNPTMHVEKKYTEDEAEHVFFAVRGFMKKLASRCDEEGEPKVP